MKPALHAHPEALSPQEMAKVTAVVVRHTAQRTAKVEYSYCIPPCAPLHWKLTMTGDGKGCTAGKGHVHRYARKQDAEAMAAEWIASGTTGGRA